MTSAGLYKTSVCLKSWTENEEIQVLFPAVPEADYGQVVLLPRGSISPSLKYFPASQRCGEANCHRCSELMTGTLEMSTDACNPMVQNVVEDVSLKPNNPQGSIMPTLLTLYTSVAPSSQGSQSPCCFSLPVLPVEKRKDRD